MAVTDDLPFPRYLVASSGSFEGVAIAMNIDDYAENVAPGLAAELVKAVHDAITARPEFTGATVTRYDVTPVDITPAAATG